MALAAWLGFVAAAALVVGATPAFLWGALAPCFLGALAFTIVRALAPTAGELRLALVVAGAVVAVAVVLDAEGLPLGDGGDALLRRPRGLLYNRNYAGEYLALVLPVCLTAAASARDGRRLARVVHRALVVVVGLALIWTRCRTAWLAAAGGSAMVVLTAARTARPRLARVVALVVAGAALALVVPNRLQWSEAQPFAATARRLLKLKSGSGALRLEQYAATVRLVAAHPVAGLGPGGWQPAIRAGDWRLGVNRNAHSDYLRALADGGPAAAAALLALYGAALVAAWRARRRFAEAPALVLTLATISAADALLYRPEAAILAFAALAALGRRARRRLSARRSRRPASHRTRRGGAPSSTRYRRGSCALGRVAAAGSRAQRSTRMRRRRSPRDGARDEAASRSPRTSGRRRASSARRRPRRRRLVRCARASVTCSPRSPRLRARAPTGRRESQSLAPCPHR